MYDIPDKWPCSTNTLFSCYKLTFSCVADLLLIKIRYHLGLVREWCLSPSHLVEWDIPTATRFTNNSCGNFDAITLKEVNKSVWSLFETSMVRGISSSFICKLLCRIYRRCSSIWNVLQNASNPMWLQNRQLWVNYSDGLFGYNICYVLSYCWVITTNAIYIVSTSVTVSFKKQFIFRPCSYFVAMTGLGCQDNLSAKTHSLDALQHVVTAGSGSKVSSARVM